jgi:Ca2+-binding RTX toxin-like protein
MAIYTVGLDSDYFSIADVLEIAAPGDTILLEAGYGPETVTIATNNLTVSGEASSFGIVLKLAADVAVLQLLGDAPIEVQDGPGGNFITGNEGFNLITVSQGADAVDGGPGTDRLVVDYGDSTAAITGDSTSNFSEAGTGRMVTITNETIESFTVRTGTGADTITTHSGNDVISLGSGANTATAGDGDNRITGGDDADTITTGSGNDYVAAGAGTNTVTTSAGNDTVLSGSGADTIILGDGDDEVTVTGGADTVDAGDGEDKLIVDYSASTANIDSTELFGDFFVGYSGSFTAGAGDIVGFSRIENFEVTGGTGDDTITAGDGEDEFIGGDGNDILKGNGGNDTFTGGSGNDILDGGDGIDTAYFSGQRGDYVFEQIGPGAVTVEDTRDGSPDGTDTLYNVELQLFANTAPTGTVIITGEAAEDQVLIASSALVDVDGLGEISYQWLADGAAIAGATNANLTLAQGQVGKIITVVASYTDGQGRAESATSAPTDTVANVNDAPTGRVIITGEAAENQVLTASNTLADEDGLGTATYQWLADGEAIAGATNASLTLAQGQVGKVITVAASYTDGQGTAERETSAATETVTNINNAPTGTVTITGTAAEDEVLTASNNLADQDGLGEVSYQWLADGAPIDGATEAELTLTQDEVGKAITVVASYTDEQGTSESATSEPTELVINVNDEPGGEVTISGTLEQGGVLTASNDLTDEDGIGADAVSYQWFADGAPIEDATETELTLTQDEVGKAITVVASYTDEQGTPEAATSQPTELVINVNDEPEGEVVISGTAAEDQVLTATNTLTDGDGIGTDAVSYQWLADGEAIAGATNASFMLTQGQVGKSITVAASYTDSQNTAESVTSAATGPVANVNDAPVGDVTISGTAAEDEVLTASNALTDEDGLGPITYQWQADGSSIAGATDANYTVTQSEVGKAITVVASYVDLYGTNEAVASAATGAVAAGLPSFYFTTTDTGVSGQVKAMVYNGPVTYLTYEFAGTSSNEAVIGTAANDFLHLGAGDDAVDGGEGRDVIDGGTGSNFLTGGSGSDVFFLDGRNGETTWSTITDWQQGEQLSVWGWRDGVSQATFMEDTGAAGYRGVTMHADLNGNGVIDTSVTWRGLTQANLPVATTQDGLLWFA